jgi:voltage-gated potassium channel
VSGARRLLAGLLLLAATLTAGTLGFELFEGWTTVDAFYTTVLVVSTLGFSTQHPTTLGAKLLTIGLIGGGVGTLYYVLGVLVQGLIEGQIGTRRLRRQKRQMQELKDHYIVCGYGRVGQEVVRELRREGQALVIVDPDEKRVGFLRDEGLLAHRGDASRDETLRAVGLERARGLVVCTGSDAVNVFVTLSARSLREDLLIVARAIHEDDEPKLLRAGANRAITPASLGGRRMAGLLLRPTVIELLDVLVRNGELEMWLEEAHVSDGSSIRDKSLGQVKLREDVGVTILAVKRKDGEMVTNPPAETMLRAGDILVALGTHSALQRLGALALGRAS